MSKEIRFIPSYVGSKKYWIPYLSKFANKQFVEPFCGSSILSANLASSCILNDIDPFVYKILKNFRELEVPLEFTPEDYFKYRSGEDWWKWIYCLQSNSFSGVFRYSKNGYNVPIKYKKTIRVRPLYLEALKRYNELLPIVYNTDYYGITDLIKWDSVLILDPPYEDSQTSYNGNFNYHLYWEWLMQNESICKDIVVFDYLDNLPFGAKLTKKLRVNGSKKGNIEGMFTFSESKKSGDAGENKFFEKFKDKLNKLDGKRGDFELKETGEKIELKSDYYDSKKTPNFFIERYSNADKKTPGGPWQSVEHGVKWYIYSFIKNDEYYVFDVNKLITKLDKILPKLEMKLIRNTGYNTGGYLINRELLKELMENIL